VWILISLMSTGGALSGVWVLQRLCSTTAASCVFLKSNKVFRKIHWPQLLQLLQLLCTDLCVLTEVKTSNFH
jgi:hypothetical protein